MLNCTETKKGLCLDGQVWIWVNELLNNSRTQQGYLKQSSYLLPLLEFVSRYSKAPTAATEQCLDLCVCQLKHKRDVNKRPSALVWFMPTHCATEADIWYHEHNQLIPWVANHQIIRKPHEQSTWWLQMPILISIKGFVWAHVNKHRAFTVIYLLIFAEDRWQSHNDGGECRFDVLVAIGH